MNGRLGGKWRKGVKEGKRIEVGLEEFILER